LKNSCAGAAISFISELCCTEVVSAVGRRKREGALNVRQASEIRKALLADAKSGSFRCLDLSPAVHREAERMLLSTGPLPLRTLDALHVALALSGEAQQIVTFDDRMADAARLNGLDVVEVTGPTE
jgi:predicted nucleic acid-binding protein